MVCRYSLLLIWMGGPVKYQWSSSVDNTCETRVDGGNKDGLILLQTATVGEIDAGVLNGTVGAKAKPFSITVGCSQRNPSNPGSTAKMTFGSVSLVIAKER